MHKSIKILSNKEGFTLIELMIVLVVLGILSGIAIPRISDIRTDARVSTARSELASLRGQFISFNARNDRWPENNDNFVIIENDREGALWQMWKDMDTEEDGDYVMYYNNFEDDDNDDSAEFGVAVDVTGNDKIDWFMSDIGIKEPDDDSDIGINDWDPTTN
ncbi:MAG: type IV pilin protein [Bacillota bacterium]